ncbi:hypothetical protein Tco_0192477, partial [Tanacetum coccineum]
DERAATRLFHRETVVSYGSCDGGESRVSLLLGLKDFKMILRVTTAQLQLLEGLMLSEMRSKTYQRRDKS